jgi:iron complex transport system substrate-binding protein
MKKIFLILCLALALPCAGGGLGWGANLPSPAPSRIISLKPNVTEILFALGVGDKIVGDTTWCDYPPAAKTVTKVADYISVDTEKIIALRPDLVVGSEENSIKKQLGILNDAGIKTLTLPFRTLSDLYSSVEKIAEAVGRDEAGKQLVSKMKREIATKLTRHPREGGDLTNLGVGDSRIRGNDISTTLILVGKRPLVAAGAATFLNEIVAAAGMENIVTARVPAYPTISTELVLAKSPDVIIDLTMGSEITSDLPKGLKSRVVKFDMSDFRAGPRIGEAVRKIRASLRGTK